MKYSIFFIFLLSLNIFGDTPQVNKDGSPIYDYNSVIKKYNLPKNLPWNEYIKSTIENEGVTFQKNGTFKISGRNDHMTFDKPIMSSGSISFSIKPIQYVGGSILFSSSQLIVKSGFVIYIHGTKSIGLVSWSKGVQHRLESKKVILPNQWNNVTVSWDSKRIVIIINDEFEEYLTNATPENSTPTPMRYFGIGKIFESTMYNLSSYY